MSWLMLKRFGLRKTLMINYCFCTFGALVLIVLGNIEDSNTFSTSLLIISIVFRFGASGAFSLLY